MTQSRRYSTRIYSQLFGPRRETLGTPIVCQEAVAPRVVRLLFACRPLAVFLAVARAVIHTFQCKTFRAWPHVVKKARKGLPLFLNSNPAPAIVSVIGIF